MAAGEACVEVVPVGDGGFAEVVAEVDDLAVASVGDVDEAAGWVFELDAERFELVVGGADGVSEGCGGVGVFGGEGGGEVVSVGGGAAGGGCAGGLDDAEFEVGLAEAFEDGDEGGEEVAGFLEGVEPRCGLH